jgi:hypothetical protein
MSSTKTDVQLRLLDRLTVLTRDIKNQHFAVGDLLLEMEASGGEWDYLTDACQVSGYDGETLLGWRTVAKRISLPLRNGFDLTWSHWVAVSRLKQRTKDKSGFTRRVPATVEAMEEVCKTITPETTVVELRQLVDVISGGTEQEVTITLSSTLVDMLISSKRLTEVKGLGEFVQNMVVDQILAWGNKVKEPYVMEITHTGACHPFKPWVEPVPVKVPSGVEIMGVESTKPVSGSQVPVGV